MVSPLSLPFTARLYESCDIFGYLCCLLYVSFESLDSWSWGIWWSYKSWNAITGSLDATWAGAATAAVTAVAAAAAAF